MDKVALTFTRKQFRHWLEENAASKVEVFVYVKKGKPQDDGLLYYLDAVEEALCFGYIDSTAYPAGELIAQRFGPRTKNSPWSELNKERCRRLIALGLMDELGFASLPPLGPKSFHIDDDVEQALKEARVYSAFKRFPPLYQRIRAYNVAFFKKRDPATYQKALNRLIEETKKGKMYGEWNDYGRLLQY